jgi:hypothetical protein
MNAAMAKNKAAVFLLICLRGAEFAALDVLPSHRINHQLCLPSLLFATILSGMLFLADLNPESMKEGQ